MENTFRKTAIQGSGAIEGRYYMTPEALEGVKAAVANPWIEFGRTEAAVMATHNALSARPRLHDGVERCRIWRSGADGQKKSPSACRSAA